MTTRQTLKALTQMGVVEQVSGDSEEEPQFTVDKSSNTAKALRVVQDAINDWGEEQLR